MAQLIRALPPILNRAGDVNGSSPDLIINFLYAVFTSLYITFLLYSPPVSSPQRSLTHGDGQDEIKKARHFSINTFFVFYNKVCKLYIFYLTSRMNTVCKAISEKT